MREKLIAADISLGVAVVALAVSLYVALKRPSGPPKMHAAAPFGFTLTPTSALAQPWF